MATESSKMSDIDVRDDVASARRRAQIQRAQDETDPDAIRANIRVTREEMTETLNAIQERLDPQRLKEEAVGSVRRATIGRVEDAADEAKWKAKGVGNDMFETIKRNPAPAVLAAVGLGWLFMESRGRANERQYGRQFEGDMRRSGRMPDRYYMEDERYDRGGYGYTYDEYGRRSMEYGEPHGREFERRGQDMRERAGEVVSQASSRVQDVASQASSKVQDAASQASGKVQDAASQAADAVQDAAASVKDTAGQVVDSARQGVQQAAYRAQYGAERVSSRFGDMLQENPLVIGAAAVALGAIVGFAFPTTEKENEIMGEARDRVMDRAQEVASQTAQKVQHVAQEVVTTAKETVKDEAQKQNLTSGSSKP